MGRSPCYSTVRESSDARAGLRRLLPRPRGPSVRFGAGDPALVQPAGAAGPSRQESRAHQVGRAEDPGADPGLRGHRRRREEAALRSGIPRPQAARTLCAAGLAALLLPEVGSGRLRPPDPLPAPPWPGEGGHPPPGEDGVDSWDGVPRRRARPRSFPGLPLPPRGAPPGEAAVPGGVPAHEDLLPPRAERPLSASLPRRGDRPPEGPLSAEAPAEPPSGGSAP